MTDSPVRVGVIGCGNISGIYLKNSRASDAVRVVACADLDLARAQARAAEFDVPMACPVEDVLADPGVDVVLNLTVPAAHAEIGAAALQAGKHLYNEKPLALGRDDARRLLELAVDANLRVGCAPDTFLGAGLQTCRALIDADVIGEPIGASAAFLSHGPESWHPDPDFFYQPGAGPMLDMGPYYLTALVALMGPVRRVSGSATVTFPERRVSSQPHYGASIQVRTPTHVAGIMEMQSGAVATMTASFDVWTDTGSRLEIYGTKGTLRLPDPNTFGGPVAILEAGAKEWTAIPLRPGPTANSRGLGLDDMARALASGEPHRADGALAYHVLDVMLAFFDAARDGRRVEMASTCRRPAPVE